MTLKNAKCDLCGSAVQIYSTGEGTNSYVPSKAWATLERLVWVGVMAQAITVGKAAELLDLSEQEANERFGGWMNSDEARSLPDFDAAFAREAEGVPAEIPAALGFERA